MNLAESNFGDSRAREGEGCQPCKRRRVDESSSSRRFKAARYTDADLAIDMNAMTFEERRAMEEDIHGLGDMVEETDDFVAAKIAEMTAAMKTNVSERKREAWERAVFLRPSLATDKDLHLMLLRAARFDSTRAAVLLASRYFNKRRLFGENMLHRRISWEDLTPKEHDHFRTGFYMLINGCDRAGRGITYSRLCKWDVESDPLSFGRVSFYIASAIEDFPEMQKRGVISIGDFRGEWINSFLQVIQYISSVQDSVDNLPFHNGSSHLLYDNPRVNSFIQGIRAVLNKDHRLRHRLHHGSTMELGYTLQTFGIDLMDSLAIDSTTGSMSPQGIEEEIQRRLKRDEEWRIKEAPYTDSKSRTALFPNDQDIILGRSKKIAMNWPGNRQYHELINQQALAYIATEGQHSVAKTAISLQTLNIMQNDFNARFLNRTDNGWQALDDLAAQRKISQGLRDAARMILEAE